MPTRDLSTWVQPAITRQSTAGTQTTTTTPLPAVQHLHTCTKYTISSSSPAPNGWRPASLIGAPAQPARSTRPIEAARSRAGSDFSAEACPGGPAHSHNREYSTPSHGNVELIRLAPPPQEGPRARPQQPQKQGPRPPQEQQDPQAALVRLQGRRRRGRPTQRAPVKRAPANLIRVAVVQVAQDGRRARDGPERLSGLCKCLQDQLAIPHLVQNVCQGEYILAGRDGAKEIHADARGHRRRRPGEGQRPANRSPTAQPSRAPTTASTTEPPAHRNDGCRPEEDGKREQHATEELGGSDQGNGGSQTECGQWNANDIPGRTTGGIALKHPGRGPLRRDGYHVYYGITAKHSPCKVAATGSQNQDSKPVQCAAPRKDIHACQNESKGSIGGDARLRHHLSAPRTQCPPPRALSIPFGDLTSICSGFFAEDTYSTLSSPFRRLLGERWTAHD